MFTYQVEVALPNTVGAAEQVLAGQRKDADGNVLPNVADLSGAGTDGRFVIPGTINFDDADPDTHGNFQNDPAVHVPGIAAGDNYAQEILTYIDLPAGVVGMGVNSDDGFRTTAGVFGDVFAAGTVVGEVNGGRGAADSIFYFNVPEAGVYPFRTIWFEGGGDSSVEWFTVNEDGTKDLINGTAATARKAYRAVAAGTAKAVVRKVTPALGVGGVANDVTISAEIVDGATAIAGASLKLDGVAVNATVTKAGTVTTVSYKNTTPFAEASVHTATVSYTDGTTPISRDWKFTAQNNYLIGYWDFNDASDPTKAIDKVGGSVGTLIDGAKYTDAGKGRSGQGADRAAKMGTADPVVNGSINVTGAGKVSFLNAGGIQNQLAISYWQRLDVIKNSSAFWTRGEGTGRGACLPGAYNVERQCRLFRHGRLL